MNVVAIVVTVFLFVVMSGCGSEHQAAPATAQTAVTAQSSDVPLSPKPVVTISPTPAPVSSSYYFADAAALPECDSASEGWLAYLKSPGEFQACEGGSWTTVDVDGATGAAGPSGPVGATGAVGASGVQGVAGTNGAPGYPGLNTVWTDPDNPTSLWQFMSVSTQFSLATSYCQAPFALPNTYPALKFFSYFSEFIATLPANSQYWGNSLAVGGATASVWNLSNGASESLPVSGFHIVLCHQGNAI